jgi:uncharacterized phage-associated protein
MIALDHNKGINGGNTMSLSTNQLSTKLDTISDYFVLKSTEVGRPITNKKIQKLAYYSQAWHLVFNDGSGLFDDPIEAWMHGPAIRNLWHKYKKCGYQPIRSVPSTISIDDDTKSLLDEIWRVYGKHDAEYLETLTHSEAPWLNARGGLETDTSSSIVIKNQDMRQYYSTLNA